MNKLAELPSRTFSVQQGYDLWGPIYDTDRNFFTYLESNHTYLRQVVVNSLSKRETALDLGCGTGRHLAFLEKNFDRVVGIDFSNEMLSIARSKARPTTTLLLQNIHQFNPSEKFDFINHSFGLMHVFNLQPFMKKLKSMLKVGGKVFVIDTAEDLLKEGTTPNFDAKEFNVEIKFKIHSKDEVFSSVKSEGLNVIDSGKIHAPLCLPPQYHLRYAGRPALDYFVFERGASG